MREVGGDWPMRIMVLFVALLTAPSAVLAAAVELTPADLAVISDPSYPACERLLLQYHLPEALQATDVELAVLTLEASFDTVGQQPVTLAAFPLNGEWTSSEADWDGIWSQPGGDFDRASHSAWTVTPSAGAELRFDVTLPVRDWLEGSRDNDGIIVMAGGEEGPQPSFDSGPVRDGSGPKLIIWTPNADAGSSEGVTEGGVKPRAQLHERGRR